MQTVGWLERLTVANPDSPEKNTRLRAEANRISQTKKTAGYDIKITDQNGQLIATCQALAYRTGKPISL